MSREMKDSGVEWVGEIPENWNIVPLKRLSKIQTGSSPDKKEGNNNYSDESGIPWIKAENLGEFSPIHSTAEYLTENGRKLGRIYPPYTVYVCCIASIGKVGFSDIECSCNQQINGLNFNNTVNWKFGFYETIASSIEHIARSNKSVTPILNTTEEGNIKFAIPSPTEQQQIVHFLDRKCTAIDTAIEKTKKSIEKLEEYKKAVITKAVTKGIDPNAKMKDSGVEWIGEIPEDWEVKQLRTYFSRRINKNIYLQENNLLSLSYGHIVRKNIDTKEGLLPESFDGYNIVEDGDIVIRGTDLQNDHRSLRTGLVTERGIITSAYITLKPKEDVNSAYYHYLLHCYDISKVFYSMGGGLRQSLDYWEFIRMPVIHPTAREQEEIISYIKTKYTAIDAAIEKKKKAIEKWEEYKKSLIYYAVTGKIDCKNEVIE